MSSPNRSFQSEEDDQSSQQQQQQLHATEAQRDALLSLEQTLTCRLCDHFVSQPVSLGCGHFFCQTCIEHHARTSWNCPECDMSVSMSRKDGKHFFQINPQLQTLVQSMAEMQAALQQAPKEWWKYSTEETTPSTEKQTDEEGKGATTTTTNTTNRNQQSANTKRIHEDEETDDDDDDDMMFQTAPC